MPNTTLRSHWNTWRPIFERLSFLGLGASLGAGVLVFAYGGGAHLSRPEAALGSVATTMCVAVAFTSPHRFRVAWGLIAVGAASWIAGHGRWSTSAPLLSGSIPTGSIATLGSLLCLAGGLVMHLDLPSRGVAKVRSASEALMLTASILFASWVIVMPPVLAASQGATLAHRAALFAHPLGDVILLAVVAFAITRLPELAHSSILLVGGIGMIGLLSSASENMAATDVAEMRLIGFATAIAFLVIILAAIRAWQPTSTDERQPVSSTGQIVLLSAPGLSVLIVVATTLRQVTGQPVASDLTWITIGVLCLSVLLHLTVVFENHTLGRDLAQARDEAVLSSVLKSRFLANVSHEIRTPMNAVIGLTGLLLDSELDFDQRELAIGVATSAEGLMSLIDAVLDFSKIEADKVELEEIDLQLVDLLDDVALIVGESARRKGIQLSVYCEPGLVTARRGDPVRLRQILLNLAHNAVKFTPEGSVSIRVGALEGMPDTVVFTVADTGIGIPEGAQARLFEPFSQFDESTTRKYGGTGLGLGIVTGLVELQGGSIDLVSQEGVGTTFTVTLPLPRSVTRETERGLAALVGLRALVVDENGVSRTVLADVLRNWGFVVSQATTSEEAMDQVLWCDEGFALAIVEHQMEGMGGVELAGMLRRQPAAASAVILLVTSNVDLPREAAQAAGIKSVLIKPVRTSYLLRRIVDALITNPAPSSDDTPPHPIPARPSPKELVP